MCNCGAKRRAAAAAGGGGAPRGCSGPGCGVVRATPVTLTAPIPMPRTIRSVRSVVQTTTPPPPPVRTSMQMPTEAELPTVDTEIWGPLMWRFLHTAAENSICATTRKSVWDALLTAMRTGLPCPDCREHYGAWLDANPFVIAAGESNLHVVIQRWVAALHNAVNVRRGLPEWSAGQVTEMYAPGGVDGAREALAAAAVAGVAPWVIAAGEEVLRRGVL